MSDYLVTSTIKNGRMAKAMAEFGWNAAELSRQSGVCQSTIGKLLNFKISPMTMEKGWRISVVKICNTLGYEPIDLFPEHLQHEVPTNKAFVFAEQRQLAGLAENRQLLPGEAEMAEDFREELRQEISNLAPYERTVIQARFFERLSLKAVARNINRSFERVRQIEKKALKKLKRKLR